MSRLGCVTLTLRLRHVLPLSCEHVGRKVHAGRGYTAGCDLA